MVGASLQSLVMVNKAALDYNRNQHTIRHELFHSMEALAVIVVC